MATHRFPFPDDPTPVVDAARRIGVHVTTLTRWIRAGYVPAWKVGPCAFQQKRRLVVSLSQLLALAAEPVPATTR